MRIFLTLLPSGNASVPGNLTWYRNLYEPLLDIGHEVHLIQIDYEAKRLGVRLRTRKFKYKFSQKLFDTFRALHKKKPVDFFLSYLTDLEVEASVIDEIRKVGVPTANFSCNNIHQFYLTEKIAPHFDFNLHAEKDAAQLFRAIGANPIWFQMAANPKFYHPVDIAKTMDVSFVGAAYARRLYYIWNLLENGVDVHAYGPNWCNIERLVSLRAVKHELTRTFGLIKSIIITSPKERSRITACIAHRDAMARLQAKYKCNLHLPLTDEEMVCKYSESEISLGFLEVYDEHDFSKRVLTHLHLREFEAPMCRAFYFTNYSDELAEFYEPDKEVIVFSNEHELVDKVQYFLAHPEEAEKIREAGYRRALSCHTYQRRFKELFEKLLHLT